MVELWVSFCIQWFTYLLQKTEYFKNCKAFLRGIELFQQGSEYVGSRLRVYNTYRRGVALFKHQPESVGGDLVVPDPLTQAPHVVLVQGAVKHHLDLTCKNKIDLYIQLLSTAILITLHSFTRVRKLL